MAISALPFLPKTQRDALNRKFRKEGHPISSLMSVSIDRRSIYSNHRKITSILRSTLYKEKVRENVQIEPKILLIKWISFTQF